MIGLALLALLLSHPIEQAPVPWKLVWSDEFSTPGAPDPKNWTYEKGFVRNEELQWYQPQNARVEGGHLIIEGRRERVTNPNYDPASKNWKLNRPVAEYTSACVKTRGLQEWQYGRFEIRARIQARPGLWPAIWSLGVSHPWPDCGEVDLMEFYRETILANTAWGGPGSGTWDTVRVPYSKFAAKDPNWDQQWHRWRMDWDERSIKLFLDDELLNETDLSKTINPDGKTNPFHQPQYLLLNLAIGSSGGDPSKTEFPAKFEVDYVRVFQRVA